MKPIKREPEYTQRPPSLPPRKFKDKYDKDYGKGSWEKIKSERDKLNKKK